MSTVGGTMPAGSGGGLHHEIQEAIAQMELLKVPELKSVCRSVELPITGRKSVLQDRIRAYLKNSCSIGRIDPWRPKTIRILIEKSKLGQVLPKYEIIWQAIRTGAFNHPVATGQLPVSSLDDGTTPQVHTEYGAGNTVRPSDIYGDSTRRDLSGTSRKSYLHFKESPFYKIRKLIPETSQKINITNVRGVCSCKFKFTKAEWSLLQGSERFKLYLFCGAANPAGSVGNEPIQFPHPNEIRFNDAQIKDNVRGLKNKLGTAKPADLTPYLRPPPEQNILEIVYAFTKNEFFTYCYIVEEVSPEELLQEVLNHPKIIKAATLHYIRQTLSEDEDDDLVTTSTVMSLQCPVSYTRMKHPVKSIICKHLQCFDALWYIYSQMQIPTWQCAVCQIDINLEDLAICEYVDEILKNSNEDVEQVELSSDGSWMPVVEETVTKPTERPERSETVVKTENNYDDYDNIPLSRQNVAAPDSATSKEPIVISLDSDGEDGVPDNEQRASNDNTAGKSMENEVVRTNDGIPQSRLYVDSSSNMSEITLDPRAHETGTPMAVRRESDTGESSVNYINGQIPNMLEKTPLNNNVVDTSLPEANSLSLTPSTIIRGIFTPGNQQIAESQLPPSSVCNDYGSPSDRINGGSLTSTASEFDHSNSGDMRHAPLPVSNSILGLTGNAVAPPIPSSTVDTLQHEYSRPAPRQAETYLPQLPPLPSAQLGNPTDRDVNGRGTAPMNTNGVHLRSKKPIISPFIPKKPYLNMLPQKRHISHATSSSALPQHNNQVNSAGTLNDTPTERYDSIIDLTSD